MQLALVLEKHQKWIKDTIDMRDEVTHLSDIEGFSCFIHHVWEGGKTTRISYPSMPNGDRARIYMESTLQSLLDLIKEVRPFIISELTPTSPATGQQP